MFYNNLSVFLYNAFRQLQIVRFKSVIFDKPYIRFYYEFCNAVSFLNMYMYGIMFPRKEIKP